MDNAEISSNASFTIVPTPEVTLTSDASLGTDRTVCTSETMVPIRFEIENPAFTLTEAATSLFPVGVSGTSYAQKQKLD